jgi:hypothetical protein
MIATCKQRKATPASDHDEYLWVPVSLGNAMKAKQSTGILVLVVPGGLSASGPSSPSTWESEAPLDFLAPGRMAVNMPAVTGKTPRELEVSYFQHHDTAMGRK